MGLLNRMFGSTEDQANEMLKDEEKILAIWKDYLKTIPQKKAVTERLEKKKRELDSAADLQELRELLILELSEIGDEERKEKDLIKDLEAVEHNQKIKRIHRLEECLGYAETKYEYVHQLLKQLHEALQHQIHLVNRLLLKPKHPEKLISHLQQQVELEDTTLSKIKEVKTFHDLLVALATGEHLIHRMDAAEKKLLNRMQKKMKLIVAGQIQEGETYEWAMAVFNAIEDNVHQAVEDSLLDHHPHVDFEFVNRPEFVELVRKKRDDIKHRSVPEQMISVFVYVFREWYNHERD
ncbi:hypothetical protein HZB02_04610 [Candidatus Woesearchaeota archaeon]|nr:hypothetical protein [Candidatus Woesearchaeota archaeon]